MKDIVIACKKLYQKGLVSNHDGNISAFLEETPRGPVYMATPTSFSKGDVEDHDLLVIDKEGRVIQGRHKVFSEIAIHLAIYRVRPDVKCVVHAHPVTAGSFGLAKKDLGTPSIPEAIVSLGRGIFNTKFFSPLDLAGLDEELSRVLSQSDAFMIPGNGVWTVGQDVMQTYYRMELVEHVAKQHWHALQVGPVEPLPSDLVEQLLLKRPKPKRESTPIDKDLRDLVSEEVRSIFDLK